MALNVNSVLCLKAKLLVVLVEAEHCVSPDAVEAELHGDEVSADAFRLRRHG